MSCPHILGPGLAGLSAAIHGGELATAKLFQSERKFCPTKDCEVPPDKVPDEVVDDIDDRAMCQLMCCCRGLRLRQECVRQTLDEADRLLDGASRYKAEVSYNMEAEGGPAPFMHRDEYGRDTTRRSEYWRTRAQREIEGYRSRQGHVRRPDVVVVSDPTRPPTQDNIRRVIEMKFGNDKLGRGQDEAYREIAGRRDRFKVIRDSECGCDGDDRGWPDPIPVVASQPETRDAPSAWEAPVWGAATVLGLAATAALAASPFEGPLGETAAGAATATAAARFSSAWRALFTAAPAAGGMMR